jgi:hypothetical protein
LYELEVAMRTISKKYSFRWDEPPNDIARRIMFYICEYRAADESLIV